MKNKNIKLILLLLIISIVIGIFIEIIYFNRKVITLNNIEKPKIIEMSGFDKKNNMYITNSKSSYIILKLKSKYINKITFDYVSKNNYLFKKLRSYIKCR